MFEAFTAGGVAGVMAGLVAGPGVMLLIYEAVRKGRGAGIIFAAGTFAGNLLLLLLIHMGAERIFSSAAYRAVTGWGGAFVFAFIGLFCIIGSVRKAGDMAENESQRLPGGSFLKGFSLSFLTPFPVIFWAGVYSAAVYTGFAGRSLFVFFSAMLLILLASDILKALLAEKLKKIMKSATVKKLEYFAGYLFLGAAAYIVSSLLAGRI